MTGVRFTVDRGTSGEALATDGAWLEVVLPTALAPGTPVAGTLEFATGHVRIDGKVIRSRALADGGFEVRVRFGSMRREQRARITAALGDAT